MPLGLTGPQTKSLIAAWLGWAFDGLDGFLYVMVSTRFVAQLMGTTPSDPRVGERAALIQAMFMVGWAVGGAFFGRIGDKLGRSRTLTLTVLTYACFTGMSFFATEWWHLLIFRFLAALGIGGEWAAGCSLVSETLNAKHRAWASATLQSGYSVGCIAAALTAGLMATLDPKWVFVVGVTPALLTFWIRRHVPEPEEWTNAAKNQAAPPLGAIFSRDLWRTTLLAVALTGIALTTVWAFIYFGPLAIKEIPEVRALGPAGTQKFVTNVTIAFLGVSIVGNFFGTYLALRVGYRGAFTIMFVASMIAYLALFRAPLTSGNVYWVTGAAGFTALGLFGMFPLYIPRLYPTLLRTLGAGFTYNIGRLISGAGAIWGGQIAAGAGGNHMAIWWTGLLFIPGVLIAMIAPKPKFALCETEMQPR